ncbi:heterokaryon incompatibility domain-containing protein [Trichoderma austrokoningii]
MNRQEGRRRRRPTPEIDGRRLPKRTRRRTLDSPCNLCRLMFSRKGLQCLNSVNGLRHHTRASCIVSGDEGCKICKFIYLAVCKDYDRNWDENGHLIFRNNQPQRSTNNSGIYGLRCAIEGGVTDSVTRIDTFAKEDDPIAGIVQRRPLNRDVESDIVFSAAKSLLKNCMDPTSPHKHCQYSRDTVLPSRVLDIWMSEGCQSALKLKVNETETHAPYLALSYCWGGEQPLRLLLENLEILKAGIVIENLPQSIQDAIFVTRQLGFRYLWVDALCIIQNCDTDKKKEISRMSAIYKNAAVTIAASSSRRAADGFLSNDIEPYCPEFEFQVPMPGNRTGTVYMSAEPYEPEHHLDTRGWTFQEFMLSSRILFFSDYELLWQCKEVHLRSVSEKGLEYRQLLEALPWVVFDEDTEPYYGSDDTEKIYLWKTVVEQYTERDLTVLNDRLHAIMGIVCELETVWRHECMYGLWKKWFIELLTWYKPYTEREEKRHIERAPSWSWASLNGVVKYKGSISTEDAKITSITVSAVELACRILKADSIKNTDIFNIREEPDLIDAATETGRNGEPIGMAQYLLLGIAKLSGVLEHGIGLIIVEVGNGLYRRVGLATFSDMKLWENVKRRDIILEGRIERRNGEA